jgi:uncharacterized radical SAM protein YgiQ
MYGVDCTSKKECRRTSCLFPSVCRYLSDAGPMMTLLERLASMRGWKVRVASGVRHDLALRQAGYVDLLARRFTGGTLKVAPEHIASGVLRAMRKPAFELFETFEARFREASRRAGKEQYLVPYFISGHPGCTVANGVELTEYLAKRGWKVRQVQDFTPIPSTLSCAMYVSKRDEKGKKMHVPKGGEKHDQLALLRYHTQSSLPRVRKILKSAGQEDLLARIEKLGRKRKRPKR